MRSQLVVVLAACCASVGGPKLHAQSDVLAVVEIQSRSCPPGPDGRVKDRNGVAFLVQDGETNRYYLVTALHVVHKCGKADIRRPGDCSYDGGRREPGELISLPLRGQVLTWPSYDLAAFPWEGLQPKAKALLPKERAAYLVGRNPESETVYIRGFADGLACIDDSDIAFSYSNVGAQTRWIRPKAFEQARGYLSPDTRLMFHSFKAYVGASGSPLFLAGRRVIGIHHAGLPQGDGWAIMFPTQPTQNVNLTLTGLLRADARVSYFMAPNGGRTNWSPEPPPTFAQASSRDTLAYLSKLWRVDVAFVVQSRLEALPSSRSLGASVIASRDLLEPDPVDRDWALVWRVGGAYLSGSAQGEIRAPNGESIERRRFGHEAGYGELGLELLLGRLANTQWSFGFAGRIGGQCIERVDGEDCRVLFGFPLRARLSGFLLRRVPIALELGLVYERRSGTDYTYTGVGANYKHDDVEWGWSLLGGLSIAYAHR